MNLHEFSLDPGHFGIPTREELVALRIWDGHYHGFNETDDDALHFETMQYVDRMGIEKVVSLDIGSDRWDPFAETPFDRRKLEILQQDERVLGIIRVDPSDPDASCEKMERWIRRGPCIGIKYSGWRTNRDGITSSHPNNDPIIRLAGELGAVVYIHTWMKVGDGTRRRGNPGALERLADGRLTVVQSPGRAFPGGGNDLGESSPMDVALLAQRFPDVPLICGHSGGDWELAVRVIRPHRNILLEFSGSDPHSGSVDYAAKELGADRLVWGGHGPSRSLATELGKVLDSGLSKEDQMKVFGRNYRRICADLLRSKGRQIEV